VGSPGDRGGDYRGAGDGRLRTGTAKFSESGLKRQDNDSD